MFFVTEADLIFGLTDVAPFTGLKDIRHKVFYNLKKKPAQLSQSIVRRWITNFDENVKHCREWILRHLVCQPLN